MLCAEHQSSSLYSVEDSPSLAQLLVVYHHQAGTWILNNSLAFQKFVDNNVMKKLSLSEKWLYLKRVNVWAVNTNPSLEVNFPKKSIFIHFLEI